MRSGSSAATSGSLFVRRNTRMPLRARSAASPSPAIWAMKAGRVPTSPGLVKSRSAHRSPRPFSIGVPVSATRVRAGSRRSCWAVSLAGFLMAWASSRTIRAHGRSASASTSRTAVPYVVMTTSASATSDSSSSAVAREAPWWTTTRSWGVKRAASAAQLPTTAGGAMTSTGPWPVVRAMWARTVGVLPRPMSSARQPPSSTASRKPSQDERLGLVAAELAGEALRPGGGGVGRGLRLLEQLGGPAGPGHGHPTERRCLQAEPVAEDLGAGQRRHAGPLGQRGRGLLEVDPVQLDPAPAGLHERPGLGGQAGDVGRGELDVVEHHRPAHVAELVGTDVRLAGGLGEQAEHGAGPAARQGRHPDVEAGGLQLGAGDGHQLPRLVLAQHDLAPAHGARAVQDGEHALEPDELVGQQPWWVRRRPAPPRSAAAGPWPPGRAPTGTRRRWRRAARAGRPGGAGAAR